jgi:tol-pal system protein YbgF
MLPRLLPAVAVLSLLADPGVARTPAAPDIGVRLDRLERDIDAAAATVQDLARAIQVPVTPVQWGWGQQQQDDTAVRMGALEGRMRQLNGQIEQLQHQLRRMEDQMRRFQEDAEFRFQQLEGQGRRPAQNRPQQRGEAVPAEAPPSSAVVASPGVGAAGIAPIARQGTGTPPQSLGQLPADPRTGEPLDLAAGARRTLPPPSGPQAPAQPVAVVTPRGGGAMVPPNNPREAYDLAYGYFLRGDYQQAEESFENFIASFPTDRQAGDALYWLGESHYQRRQWRQAADAFLKSYTEFPQGPKAPESLLRLGMSMRQLGQTEAACASFAEVLRRYPRASQAVRQRVQTEQRGAGCA